MRLREPDVGSLIALDRHSCHGLRERPGQAAEGCSVRKKGPPEQREGWRTRLRGVLGEAEAPQDECGNVGNGELKSKRSPGGCPMVPIWEESEIEQKMLEPKWLRSVLLFLMRLFFCV